ncbi:WD repeat domain-containing protein [Zalerion maritima]|uniref:WD repeat domain-containing protein n=1 Tax=Zalerion maritima TaxID=339359 RepID=A0AAD5RRD4_9PEZI|nr:WD repeat domain-containing protein [Zalerion maritima]
MAMAPRIFPVGDSSVVHEPAAVNEPATIQPPLARGRSFSLPWRPRPKSMLLSLNENTMRQNYDHAGPSSGETTDLEHHGKGAIRSIVRRASASLKGFVHRDFHGRRGSAETTTDRLRHDHSHAYSHTESRPGTSWQRLRQRASFIHHSRDLHRTMTNFEALPSPTFPVPGSGTEPPIIPRHTGAAAKASAAAAQTEFFVAAPGPKFPLMDSGIQGDRESGIGINMAASETGTETDDEESDSVKIDFVSDLPVELAIQVCSLLDADNLLAAGEVSRSWNFVIRNQHVWRDSFLREMATTYATGAPALPGVGLGIPSMRPQSNWKQIYQAREVLDKNWRKGKVVPTHLIGHTDSIYCVQFDESKIITGSRDRTIRIWDMHTFECRLVIGPPDVVNRNSIFLDETGQPVHCAQRDGVEVATSMPAAVSFPVHHHASVLCLQYDDRILVTGSSDSTCIVHNMRSGYRPIRRLAHHDAAVLDVVFDDKHIVTCSKDVSICVWDRETGTLIKQLRGHTGPVNAVQLRGNTIVSCSGDFLVKLWNIDSGNVVREFLGHNKGLACSQFSEDGKYIASAGNDKTIRVWDANTGDCLHEMHAHEGLVRSLHIDSVSGRLISASYDQDIKVWDLETGRLLLDFPKWHHSWVLAARSDYRRIVSTGQDPKILIMDFGAKIPGIDLLESVAPSGLDVSEHQQTFI